MLNDYNTQKKFRRKIIIIWILGIVINILSIVINLIRLNPICLINIVALIFVFIFIFKARKQRIKEDAEKVMRELTKY